MAARKRPLKKKTDPYLGGICFITDRNLCPLTCMEMTQAVLRAGIKWVQYRDKEKDRLAFYRTALGLREITRCYGASFVVNDHADIAAAVDADGIHLGQDDLPLKEARKLLGREKIIGISTHSVEEAIRAEEDGADYIGFGPVFETATKDAGTPRGTGMLEEVRGRVNIPVVAIGGIDAGSVSEVLSSGAGAVAVASAVLRGDLSQNAHLFLQGIRNGRN